MVGGENVNMIEFSESKLNTIMNSLNTLSHRTIEIEGFFYKILW